jgi:hypothetical protein
VPAPRVPGVVGLDSESLGWQSGAVKGAGRLVLEIREMAAARGTVK